MSEGRDLSRAARWLGTAAVDGARVGPFRLACSAVVEDGGSAGSGPFDVYLDGFAAPLALGVSAPDADALTRRFMSSIADWDAKLRAMQRPSIPPPSRRSSSKRPSKRPSSSPMRRASRMTLLMLFLGAVAVLSSMAYYFGTTNPPDTTEPPPVRD